MGVGNRTYVLSKQFVRRTMLKSAASVQIRPSCRVIMHMLCVCACSCACPPGFEGRHCEINPDDCEDNDCENNSTCIDGINNYTCVCPPNYAGRHPRKPTLIHPQPSPLRGWEGNQDTHTHTKSHFPLYWMVSQ